MSTYLLALDFGHGGGRALLVDAEFGTIFSASSDWSYFSPEGDEFRQEFSPPECFDILCGLVRHLLADNHVAPDSIAGIAATSMRHSYVCCDGAGRELYGGANTDARGLYYQDVIEEDLGFDPFDRTGQCPPLVYLPARLLWFKEEAPELFGRMASVMSTADWLTWRLSGELITEPSLASSTMLFDIAAGAWMPEVCDSLDLGELNLPDLAQAGHRAGGLRADIARRMNLLAGTPVAVGGADTQLGLLAMQALNPGDVGVVAGTSTPVMKVAGNPDLDNGQRFWTSCHVIHDRWVLESNAQMAGRTYDWLVRSFRELAGWLPEEAHARFDSMASAVPAGSNSVLASLGPEIFNANDLGQVRPAVFSLPQPAHPLNTQPATLGCLARAALENAAFAVLGNLKQLEEVGGDPVPRLRVTGGMSCSIVWCGILASVTGWPVMATRETDGTGIGCAVAAGVGAGLFDSLESGAAHLARFHEPIPPSPSDSELYSRLYRSWRQLYDKLTEL